MQSIHPYQIPQKSWHKLIPKKYVIPASIIELSPAAVQWLLSDDTNPDCLTFPHYGSLTAGLAELKGCIFLKLAERTARDIALPLQKIQSVDELVNVIKLSEYLTQGLDENDKNGIQSHLILRQYIPDLVKQQNQYKIYVRDEVVVGICQKHPNHKEEQPPQEKVKMMFELVDDISSVVSMVMPNWAEKDLHSFVVDVCFLENNIKITAITKFFIGSLSLFTEEQLNSFYLEKVATKDQQTEQQNRGVWPIIRTVKKENELKEKDMSDYKMGNQIANKQMAQEWKSFVKESQKKFRE